MPSPTLAAELGSAAAGRAIFWGVVPVPAAPAAPAPELELIVHGEGGEASRIGLGAAVAEAAPPPVPGDRGPALAICMATYEPPAELLERQLASLADQTVTDWVCVISDDASSDAAYGRLEELTADDRRFVVSRAPERAGAYANFARALAMVPPGARHVALCDQDDRWYEAKLETLLGALGDARMVFSDMRLTTPAGAPISDTYWTARVPNHDNFALAAARQLGHRGGGALSPRPARRGPAASRPASATSTTTTGSRWSPRPPGGSPTSTGRSTTTSSTRTR